MAALRSGSKLEVLWHEMQLHDTSQYAPAPNAGVRAPLAIFGRKAVGSRSNVAMSRVWVIRFEILLLCYSQA